MRHVLSYFAVEHVDAFKSVFHAGFQSGHCHILCTGPYQVIVPACASVHK